MFKIWLLSQWEKSNIISGVLALGIWSVICYLAIAQLAIPDVLIGAGGIVVGFFFKAKKEKE